MSIEREGQLIRFSCDECGAELEIISRDFRDAWDSAKEDHDWRCFRNDQTGEFEHRCPSCRYR